MHDIRCSIPAFDFPLSPFDEATFAIGLDRSTSQHILLRHSAPRSSSRATILTLFLDTFVQVLSAVAPANNCAMILHLDGLNARLMPFYFLFFFLHGLRVFRMAELHRNYKKRLTWHSLKKVEKYPLLSAHRDGRHCQLSKGRRLHGLVHIKGRTGQESYPPKRHMFWPERRANQNGRRRNWVEGRNRAWMT